MDFREGRSVRDNEHKAARRAVTKPCAGAASPLHARRKRFESCTAHHDKRPGNAGSWVFSLSSDLSAGRNRDLLRQSCVRRCHCRRIVPAHQHVHPVVRRQQKDGLDTGCSTACAASRMASGCINVVLIAEAAVGQFLHSGGCAQQFFRNKGVKVVPRIAYAVAGHKLDKQFVAAVSVDCNGIRSA